MTDPTAQDIHRLLAKWRERAEHMRKHDIAGAYEIECMCDDVADVVGATREESGDQVYDANTRKLRLRNE